MPATLSGHFVLDGLVQNVCPNAASVIELKTSWESVLFAFRSPFTVLCCCMAWGKGTVLYCLYMYCFARIDTGNSRSEKFVIVAGNKLFTFAFSQRIGTTTSVFLSSPSPPFFNPLAPLPRFTPPFHVQHYVRQQNTGGSINMANKSIARN